jgi:hypothetical protein
VSFNHHFKKLKKEDLDHDNWRARVAVVARDELDGIALKQLGAPNVLYPMRDAVNYAVESLAAIIHPKEPLI